MAEPLILASASPRRRQLLEMIGIEVRVIPSNAPEIHTPGETAVQYTERLARAKAEAVAGPLVLAADTTVVLDGTLLEKPADSDDALRMLRLLQGRTHEVVTAVALVADGTVRQATDVTRVTFRPADDDFLRRYIATGEPMDKAGAYGIQGYGAALVDRIEGDFFSVMGLPLRLVLRLLGEAGHPYRFPAPRFDLQPVLRGELLELRPLVPGDFGALYAVASDPLIWEQHPESDRHTPERFRIFFANALASGGAFVAVDRRSGRIIGSSRYHGYDPEASEVEIGWTFLAREYWGGRYNAEMKRLMLDHAFRFVRRVVFLVGPENRRSQRAVEKIGGVRAGMRRGVEGRESVVYEMLRDAGRG